MDGVRAREYGDQTQRAALYTAGAMAGAPVWLASCAARRSRAPAPPVGFSYVGENTTWRAAAGFNSSADVAALSRPGGLAGRDDSSRTYSVLPLGATCGSAVGCACSRARVNPSGRAAGPKLCNNPPGVT